MNLDLETNSNLMLIHNSVVIYQCHLIRAEWSVVRDLFAYLSLIRRILITNHTGSDYCIGFATKSITGFNERCLFNAQCYQAGRSGAAVRPRRYASHQLPVSCYPAFFLAHYSLLEVATVTVEAASQSIDYY